MKLLTFLGAPRQYYLTEYEWEDQTYTTKYAPDAACRFLQPEEVIIFLTEKARNDYFQDFSEKLPEGIKKTPVDIPMGENENELWRMFEVICDSVDPGETVSFDITHGLRAFPLISLLAAAYLRSGLDVRLSAVLYGAFEVRDQGVEPHCTPMFDLAPLIQLLEWAAAADRFNRTGDARYLASLVKSQRKNLAIKANGDPEKLSEVGRLGNLAGALEDVSRSLRLLRPYRAMKAIHGLPERVEKAMPALENSQVHPFQLLLDSILATYKPLADAEPNDTEKVFKTLEVERGMIRWFAERNHWVQAVCVAREWLTSWVMAQLGLTDLTSRRDRVRVEKALGAEATEWRISKEEKHSFQPVFLQRLPDWKGVFTLWQTLTQTRNDIVHVAKNRFPTPPEDLIDNIRECLEDIEHLPLKEAL